MTVDRTVRITGTEMKETINQFEQDRRSNGTRKAVRSLISEAFLIWMDALEQASAENDESCRVSVTRTECSSIGTRSYELQWAWAKCCPYAMRSSSPP